MGANVFPHASMPAHDMGFHGRTGSGKDEVKQRERCSDEEVVFFLKMQLSKGLEKFNMKIGRPDGLSDRRYNSRLSLLGYR